MADAARDGRGEAVGGTVGTRRRQGDGATQARANSLLVRVATFCAPGMVGFYVLQALFSRGWHHLSYAVLGWAMRAGTGAFLLAGIVFSVAFFVVVIILDALVRRTWFDRLLGRTS